MSHSEENVQNQQLHSFHQHNLHNIFVQRLDRFYYQTCKCFICYSVCFLDNVHFQQAAEISEALVLEEVDFEAMVGNLRNPKSVFRFWVF